MESLEHCRELVETDGAQSIDLLAEWGSNAAMSMCFFQ